MKNVILEKIIGEELSDESISYVDNIITKIVGNNIQDKINYLIEYMTIKKMTSCVDPSDEETYEMLIESLIDGDYKILNGEK